LRDAPNRSFYPSPGSALINWNDPSYGIVQDFAHRFRDALPDAGAYEYAGETETLFPIAEGFKKFPIPTPSANPGGLK
jgi:hypothetical protein